MKKINFIMLGLTIFTFTSIGLKKVTNNNDVETDRIKHSVFHKKRLSFKKRK